MASPPNPPSQSGEIEEKEEERSPAVRCRLRHIGPPLRHRQRLRMLHKLIRQTPQKYHEGMENPRK